MADRTDITPELCRQLLRYEPETGKLFWKERPREMFGRNCHWRTFNTRFAGKEAFTQVEVRGYLVSEILHVPHKAHRVAWAIHHGDWPHHEIDHINGDRLDNRITNLRDVPRHLNAQNLGIGSRNKSGTLGVSWCKRDKTWSADIKMNGRKIHLGNFATKEAAVTARLEAEKRFQFMGRGKDQALRPLQT